MPGRPRGRACEIRPDTTAGRLVFDGTRCTGADVTGAGTAPERIIRRAG